MKLQSFLSIEPEEMPWLSDLRHVFERIQFAVVRLVARLGELDAFTWASTAWSIRVWISTMLLLFLLSLPQLPDRQRSEVRRDPVALMLIAAVQRLLYRELGLPMKVELSTTVMLGISLASMSSSSCG